jgi:maltooligosyltrehalose synthase
LVGAVNGLAQTLLKLTVPGVPDTYQGCELWDLSLVDPDNRRPVDYALRRAYLEQDLAPATLLADWRDGRIKQQLIARTLALRRRHPELFATGSYEALDVTGRLADRVIAFARRSGQALIVVVVPRLIAALLRDCERPCPAPAAWGDTQVPLPADFAKSLRDELTARPLPAPSGSIALADALVDLPVALLTAG